MALLKPQREFLADSNYQGCATKKYHSGTTCWNLIVWMTHDIWVKAAKQGK
jgi:hypothetical protein